MRYKGKTTISPKDPQQLLWAHRVDGCSLLSRIEWLNCSTEGISGYTNPTRGGKAGMTNQTDPTTGLAVSRVCLLAKANDHPESSTSQEQGMNEERVWGKKKEDELGLGSKDGRVLESESSSRRYATELSSDYSKQHTSTLSHARGRH